MKFYVVGIFLGVGVFITAAISTGAMDPRGSERQVLEYTRACTPRIGASAVRLQATTGTDADSGALNLDSVYMIQCDTAAWVRFGASAVTAVANDWLVSPGEIYFIPTGGQENMRHISALSKTVNGDCRLLECR
jgi:hypothetical protein